ncbi:MAG: chemotaxis response regulator protein-glutamate methylesterase [Nitrospinaceae bacterium]|nr:MAG: chemotaxis response regulator protein-glutamate methylesterase [Nitrospinaceae bacterium]
MSTTRILIVDDEASSRNLLRKTLSVYSNLDIVGSVSTCRIALSKIPQVNPDIVILDLDMPDTDVTQILLEIRKSHPDLPVLMLCTKKHNKNAARVLAALAAGANDYIPKSEKLSAESGATEEFRVELFKKLRPFCQGPLKQQTLKRLKGTQQAPEANFHGKELPTKTEIHERPRTSKKDEASRIDILAIGVSTGGPQALEKVLPKLPEDFPVPIVIVQHMPSNFTGILAKRLNSKSSLFVKEGQKGDTLRPGQAWLAAGGMHMVVQPGKNKIQINTHMGPPENSCRPAVDVLLRSVADCYGSHALAVILTGMGQDGLRGCESIQEFGGTIYAQDEESSVVWGMPGALSQAGLADKVLSLDAMAAEITRRVWQGRVKPSSTHTSWNQRSLAT